MASEQSQGTKTLDKYRVRFRKAGDLRLVSHHDLMHCFERMLRRAGLPFRSSEGFHPKPRMVFALSLALGIVGAEEVVELELTEPLPPEEVHRRLAAQAPPGLEILSLRCVPRKVPGQPRRVCYRIPLPPERRAELPARVAAVLVAPECWVERTRPQPRRLNVRPYVRDIRLPGDHLELDLWVTPQGAARPEEILALLGLEDLLRAGAVLERTKLELCDEAPADDQPCPVDRLPSTVAWVGPASRRSPTGETPVPPPKGDRAPEPLLPGPLSFDS